MSNRASVWTWGAAAAAVAALASSTAAADERAAADIACQETEEALVYDCDIVLKGRDSGAPVEDAAITVKADMPSMPMAHNVRPVAAEPMDMPGHYRARLALEMHGEWALTLDVSGPMRDRVVETVQFGDDQKAGHESMKHGEGDMEHGD